MEELKAPHGQNILAEGETIEESFDLGGYQLYATDRRLIEVKRQTIRDFDYAHISSIGYSSKRYRWLIIIGVLIGAAGMAAGDFLGDEARIAGAIVGVILIIIGVVAKSENIEVTVLGLSQSPKYKGSRKDLDSLLRIIRQKRIAHATTSSDKQEST